jgi:Uma2 family endonuclease
MSGMPAQTDDLTIERYLSLRESGYRDEVSYGRLVREPQPGDQHGEISAELTAILVNYLAEHRVGRIRTASGYVLRRAPLVIRAPDISFLCENRLPREKQSDLFEGAPDLVIEIISPSNSASDLQEKIAEYLDAGTQLVWVVYPKTRSVAIHQPNGEVRVLGSSETLTAPSLLPGFEMPIARFFI